MFNRIGLIAGLSRDSASSAGERKALHAEMIQCQTLVNVKAN